MRYILQVLTQKVLGLTSGQPLLVGLFALGISSSVWTLAYFSSSLSLLRSPVTSKLSFGVFPELDDPFHFIPCTANSILPRLEDPHELASWAQQYNADPSNWSWGPATACLSSDDIYACRGIYLCGYLDVPLDYTNRSDSRITRLAVTKYQVSGLARISPTYKSAYLPQNPGKKSDRTIVVNPGGPGVSGGRYVWNNAETFTHWLSDGRFDVISWDPRGVNASLPALTCFPHNINRDHWTLITGQYFEALPAPRTQLALLDALNDAAFMACHELYGDFPRFVGTAFVVRDLEQIRVALGEEDLTAYFSSYGTGIGQIYANMYPDRVGRIIMDGVQDTRDQRTLSGYGQAALTNISDAWRDGFLKECIESGPENCALVRSRGNYTVILNDLQKRIEDMLVCLIDHPKSAFSRYTGPTVITYSSLMLAIYVALYDPGKWPRLAEILHQLEEGNYTLAGEYLEEGSWSFEPALMSSIYKSSTVEISSLVICGDSADALPPPGGLDWWLSLWETMSAESWIGGSPRFMNVLPCRNFRKYWREPPALYRGSLNNSLKNPVLLISATHDPATPLSSGRRLLEVMGPNARLVVHHGYGHASLDRSECTDTIAGSLIRYGEVSTEKETHCFADKKPFTV